VGGSVLAAEDEYAVGLKKPTKVLQRLDLCVRGGPATPPLTYPLKNTIEDD
jgi:hypothetical protein